MFVAGSWNALLLLPPKWLSDSQPEESSSRAVRQLPPAARRSAIYHLKTTARRFSNCRCRSLCVARCFPGMECVFHRLRLPHREAPVQTVSHPSTLLDPPAARRNSRKKSPCVSPPPKSIFQKTPGPASGGDGGGSRNPKPPCPPPRVWRRGCVRNIFL